MGDTGEALFHLNKLLAYMEDDRLQIGSCVEGEFLDDYKKTLAIEIDDLNEVIRVIRNY